MPKISQTRRARALRKIRRNLERVQTLNRLGVEGLRIREWELAHSLSVALESKLAEPESPTLPDRPRYLDTPEVKVRHILSKMRTLVERMSAEKSRKARLSIWGHVDALDDEIVALRRHLRRPSKILRESEGLLKKAKSLSHDPAVRIRIIQEHDRRHRAGRRSRWRDSRSRGNRFHNEFVKKCDCWLCSNRDQLDSRGHLKYVETT